jgi:hypothetical protein
MDDRIMMIAGNTNRKWISSPRAAGFRVVVQFGKISRFVQNSYFVCHFDHARIFPYGVVAVEVKLRHYRISPTFSPQAFGDEASRLRTFSRK